MGHSRSTNCTEASQVASETRGATRLAASPTAMCPMNMVTRAGVNDNATGVYA